MIDSILKEYTSYMEVSDGIIEYDEPILNDKYASVVNPNNEKIESMFFDYDKGTFTFRFIKETIWQVSSLEIEPSYYKKKEA